jgi:hypothetical protein
MHVSVVYSAAVLVTAFGINIVSIYTLLKSVAGSAMVGGMLFFR